MKTKTKDKTEEDFIGKDGIAVVEKDEEEIDFFVLLKDIKRCIQEAKIEEALSLCDKGISYKEKDALNQLIDLLPHHPEIIREIINEDIEKSKLSPTKYLTTVVGCSAGTASRFLRGKASRSGPFENHAIELLKEKMQVSLIPSLADLPDGIVNPRASLSAWFNKGYPTGCNYLLIDPSPKLKVNEKYLNTLKKTSPWADMTTELGDDFPKFALFLKRLFYVGRQNSDGDRVYKHIVSQAKLSFPSQTCEERISQIWLDNQGPIVMESLNHSESCAWTVEFLLVSLLTKNDFPCKLAKRTTVDRYSFTNKISGSSRLPRGIPVEHQMRVAAGLLLGAFRTFSKQEPKQIFKDQIEDYLYKECVIVKAF